jgi:choline dehydrogenase
MKTDPCGTNRPGKNIGQDVVDGKIKVHSVKNFRVIDASVFPVIPDNRIQNVVYMIAERGIDFIEADYRASYAQSLDRITSMLIKLLT